MKSSKHGHWKGRERGVHCFWNVALSGTAAFLQVPDDITS